MICVGHLLTGYVKSTCRLGLEQSSRNFSFCRAAWPAAPYHTQWSNGFAVRALPVQAGWGNKMGVCHSQLLGAAVHPVHKGLQRPLQIQRRGVGRVVSRASSIPAARLVREIRSPACNPMEEPSTWTISWVISTTGSPRLSTSSSVRSAVIIFVVLAIGRWTWASFSKRTAPYPLSSPQRWQRIPPASFPPLRENKPQKR